MPFLADPPRRIPLKGEGEHDVLTGWRRVMCWTQRSGACRRTKRSYNRRFRHASRMALISCGENP